MLRYACLQVSNCSGLATLAFNKLQNDCAMRCGRSSFDSQPPACQDMCSTSNGICDLVQRLPSFLVLETATILIRAHSRQLILSPSIVSQWCFSCCCCRAATTYPCHSDTRLQIHQNSGACCCQLRAGQGSGSICATRCQDHNRRPPGMGTDVFHHWTAALFASSLAAS
jgi:hypothetical protein